MSNKWNVWKASAVCLHSHFDWYFALFFFLVTLHGIVLAKVIDDLRFFNLLPIVFGTLRLHHWVDPFSFGPECVTFQVSFVNIELWFEFVIHSSHIHQLLLSQVDLEYVVVILLLFRVKRGLNVDLLLERLKFVLVQHVLQIRVHFEIWVDHIEERTLAPIVFVFHFAVKLCCSPLNLRLLRVGYLVRSINVLSESHLGNLIWLLKHALLLLSLFWKECICEATRTIVKFISRCRVFNGLFSRSKLLLSHLRHGRVWWTKRRIRCVIEIEFVWANYAIHELLSEAGPRKRLLGHLIHQAWFLVRHGTSALVNPDSVSVLLDGVHAWVHREAHRGLVNSCAWEVVWGRCRSYLWWVLRLSATTRLMIVLDLELLNGSCCCCRIRVLVQVALSNLLRYITSQILSRFAVELISCGLQLFLVS